MPHDCGFLADLSLSPDQISFERADRDRFATDYGTHAADASRPDAVVYPASTADVSTVLAAANDRGVPVTPYAAGSSTEGNAVPVEGGISLSMERLDEILAFRPDDLQVDVEPGVVGGDLEAHVATEGLCFPAFPQSAAFSTVGGMVANDASGIRAVKYGELREWVLELEVVRADGTVLEVGSKAKKSSAGYNLVDLFVGSEGTLGVVTRVTLELAVEPARTLAGRAIFDSLDDATAAITDAIRAGIDAATVELVDSLTAEIANSYTDSGLPSEPMVFFELHGRGVDREMDALVDVLRNHDPVRVDTAVEEAERERLWRARREIGQALLEYDPDRELEVVGDVTVPIGAYAEMVRFVGEVSASFDLPIPAFGHAGDGNLHYAILANLDDEDERERVSEASGRIVQRALDAGGTCTGEHGVGVGKREYLRREFEPAVIETMRSLKATLDPEGILNPGKMFD
ncbi:FAD-binding oxidoreductase [Halogeometricum limi]|uniref:D-lactate dehydrogenase (cytochrome) n=1 Tax=Halogeometricum limi TaxID=555875 RepID=A0A1I6IB77_9EURY|nr:FAD-linked oxidase C-terminal domain-containing protein [Halogeometricum limi]SFR63997.1 D-lactate dehydrogenase (cytochrome) [Halogeometricum limi]